MGKNGECAVRWVSIGVVAASLAFGVLGELNLYAKAYLLSPEQVFFWALIVCLIISVILAPMTCCGIMEKYPPCHIVDKVFHALAGELMLVSSTVLLIDVCKRGKGDNDKRCETNVVICRNSADSGYGYNFAWLLVSTLFGLIYGCLCAVLSCMVTRAVHIESVAEE